MPPYLLQRQLVNSFRCFPWLDSQSIPTTLFDALAGIATLDQGTPGDFTVINAIIARFECSLSPPIHLGNNRQLLFHKRHNEYPSLCLFSLSHTGTEQVIKVSHVSLHALSPCARQGFFSLALFKLSACFFRRKVLMTLSNSFLDFETYWVIGFADLSRDDRF